MLQLLFKKWWVVLLQGILLIILAIFVFKNPVEVLAGISFWFGLVVMAAGVIGVFSWISADKIERENTSLLWSVLTAVFGLLMLMNLLATMATLSFIFGLWMLVTGVHLLKSGWTLKDISSSGWVMVIAGILSVIAGLMMMFNVGMATVGISTLLGLQLLAAGIALIVLSFAKKGVSEKVKGKIEDIKTKIS
jgi:uncharacterized membrane protein HdeD (DUF308 family)